MAKLVLGIASSHGPQLSMPPEEWRELGQRTKNQSAPHWFNGKPYSFEELYELRAENHFDQECTDEKFRARFDANQRGIAHLAETYRRVAADVCIILGDDQKEAFHDDNMPAFAIYHGSTVDDGPGVRRPGYTDNAPLERVSQPTDADLGQYLIEYMVAHEFDVARSNKLPEGRRGGTVGHAFAYFYHRLMDNKATPNVPIMVNTYYPPNAPTAPRCYRFGQALRQAIEEWDSDKRVAILASGGLSHTVIEEELDLRILDGLRNDDVKKLTDYPDVRFRAGTSEIKNWIALGGAMSGTGLSANIVDYVPCYRTEAGNGCAMGLAEWV